MENELLNTILSEIKNLRTEMNNKFAEVDIKFEELNTKFEELNDKFEGLNTKFEGLDDEFKGLNSEVKDLKQELKLLRRDFNRHDAGEKSAWKDFEDAIGKEFGNVNKKLDEHTAKINFLENGLKKLLKIHKQELHLAEDEEEYKIKSDND